MSKIIKLSVVFFGLFILPVGASAHSKVSTTMPENGAILNHEPQNISMNFAKRIRLTKVTLHHHGQKPIKLKLDNYKNFITQISIPHPSMGLGDCRVEWRGLGLDGHSLQGKFSFTVK